ncbi:DUF2919 domain-containing protein [Salmonella enterica]|nr:DUF2919 domain-containing protein [Salmonella enterica]EHI9911107.1 DUF2919 domain-containing protein [Salmonella enterica]
MKTMKAREAAPHIRRPGKVYRAEDYDDEGNLKAPVWLWAVVAWMLMQDGWSLADSEDLLLSCLCVDFAVLVVLLLTPRLRTVFGCPEVR